jgi:uncharacterized protein (DUF2236 family)
MHATSSKHAASTTDDATDFDVREHIDGIGALLAGTANVIMQLSWPAVGYGVLESKVESGQITRHPIKRFRTTFTYLAVAMLGSDNDRERYRDAVNEAHRLVRSEPDSPVSYNAFDPDLQLWVAACLYYGAVDVRTKLRGGLDEYAANALYRYGARFGTTLQVKPEMWPADRAAFDEYWNESLAKVSIDSTVREYLRGLVMLDHLPLAVRLTFRWASRFFTTGFLPPPFREQMQLPWTDADQRRFDRYLRLVAVGSNLLPGPVRLFPFNFFLWDLRRRVRTGRRLV